MVSSKAIHISTFNLFIIMNKAIVIKMQGFSHFTQYNLAFEITLRGCEEFNLEGEFDSLRFKKPDIFERACKCELSISTFTQLAELKLNELINSSGILLMLCKSCIKKLSVGHLGNFYVQKHVPGVLIVL